MSATATWEHNNIDQYTDWQTEDTIGANPVLATGDALVYSPNGITLTTIGPGYAGWMAKKALPIFAMLSGLLTASTDFYPSLDAVNGQAWECDTRFTDANGNTWIFDTQLDLAEGGVLRITPDGTNWIDTTFKPGIPPAGVWSTLQTVHKFGNGTSSIVSASAWGQNWIAPSTVPAVPALALKWAPLQVVKQLQLGENANGDAYELSFRNINITATGLVTP